MFMLMFILFYVIFYFVGENVFLINYWIINICPNIVFYYKLKIICNNWNKSVLKDTIIDNYLQRVKMKISWKWYVQKTILTASK